jgi:beta-1,4-mannosyl-glycoprotein beta-1,4-N-acetylglucosaminyltransferase
MSKIYDVFPFFNELDLLEIRLNHLNSHVDYFVITEATMTHAGNHKPLFFKENFDRFKRFEKKIIHQVVEGFPAELSTFERDWFQRNEVKPLLESHMQDDDILIYGDIDEIPTISGLDQSKINILNGEVMNHLAQDLFYYYVNLEEISGTLLSNMGEFEGVSNKKWLGTTVSKWSYARNHSVTSLRDRSHVPNSNRIADGGQHFSYVGGPVPSSADERIRAKLKESAHQELNIWRTNSFLKMRLSRGKDIFGRRGSKLVVRDDLTYLPPYLLNNLDKFESLIKR